MVLSHADALTHLWLLPEDSVTTQQDVPAVSKLLATLLEGAQEPNRDGGPVVLFQHNIDTTTIGQICVAQSNQLYRPDGHRSDSVSGSVTADELVKSKVADGFEVVCVAIVRAFNFGESTRHAVMTVLVKSKVN